MKFKSIIFKGKKQTFNEISHIKSGDYRLSVGPAICQICGQSTNKHTMLPRSDGKYQFMACPPRKR